MLEDHEESISLTLRTRSSKKPLRMLAKKWKCQWLPPFLARHARRVSLGRPVVRLMIPSLNLRVSWKPVKPHECISKNLYHISMRTILQEEGTIHYNITIWCTIFPFASSNENSCSEGSGGQGMWKIGEDFGVEPDESQKWERGDRWSKDEGRKSSSRLTDGHLSSEKCWIGGKAPKVQKSSCTPRRYSKRWFWILCSIYRKRIISITNDGSKSHGYHIQIARMLGTSRGCCICCNPGQNGRCSKIVENSQTGMSRRFDTSTTTQMAKIMVQYGRPSRSSRKESVWSSFGRTFYGKGNLRKCYWNTVGRKFPVGNA